MSPAMSSGTDCALPPRTSVMPPPMFLSSSTAAAIFGEEDEGRGLPHRRERKPIILAILTTHNDKELRADDQLVADIAKIVCEQFKK